MTAKSPFHKLSHIAVVVRDMDTTVKRLESLGIGPFEVATLPPGADGMFFHDKPLDAELIELKTKIGGIKLELFEPGEGESPHKEYLDSKGEGIHHIGFDVDDIDEVVAKFTEQGASIIFTGKMQGRLGAAYLDLGVGNIIMELEQK